jgi:Ca-activated chloride channel family protein
MLRFSQSMLLLLFLMSSAFGQTKIFILKGSVQDQKGQPIANALIVSATNNSDKTTTDASGLFTLSSSKSIVQIKVVREGFEAQLFAVNGKTFLPITLIKTIAVNTDDLAPEPKLVREVVVMELNESMDYEVELDANYTVQESRIMSTQLKANWSHNEEPMPIASSESYSAIAENEYKFTNKDPLNTFSIDVDRASYSNMRRFINNGSLPPADAVRIEEMINYFEYDYDAPKGKDPVAIFTEMAPAPWNTDHKLLHVGIKAKEIEKDNLPPSNMVFLIDVSGSMSAHNKLPLLKSGMKMLVNEMRAQDKVAIVVYAGAAGLVLESTPGNEKDKIIAAIDRLNSGGSTAGGAGINLAYATAAAGFLKEGNNRIILATDGDFNVGASSDQAMQSLIEKKREEGVFLTVLGFGMGNYKDSKMEILADKGNGNYAYIDNLSEARKTLVREFGSTLFTVAKDVKIQVEFNPAYVLAYRLIGYENRKLNNEDFNDDKKDAGEMGAGHVVTALYEIVPVGASLSGSIDPLKYQAAQKVQKPAVLSNEMATLKLRYKEPEQNQSKLITQVVSKKDVKDEIDSDNLKWSASLAQFGMLLRNSEYKGNTSYEGMIDLAQSALGEDSEGYRRECLMLMKNAQAMDNAGVARR